MVDEVYCNELSRLNNELVDMQRQLAKKNAELQEALRTVKTLSGLIPICCSCKRIRDDEGYWDQVESYITKHSGAQFSHGICPECVRTYYPNIAERLMSKAEQPVMLP